MLFLDPELEIRTIKEVFHLFGNVPDLKDELSGTTKLFAHICRKLGGYWSGPLLFLASIILNALLTLEFSVPELKEHSSLI